MAFKMKGFSGFKKETQYLDDKTNPPESKKKMEWEYPSKPNKKNFNNLATKGDTTAYENAYNKWKQDTKNWAPNKIKY